MKDKKLTILLSLVGVLALVFVGYLIYNQERPPVPKKAIPKTAASAVKWFNSDVIYSESKDSYIKVLKLIDTDSTVTQPEGLKRNLSMSFIDKVHQELKRYCGEEKYSNQYSDAIESSVQLIEKEWIPASEKEEYKALKADVTGELYYTKMALWLRSMTEKRINKLIGSSTLDTDWENDEIETWYSKLKSKIYNTQFVKNNPNLSKYIQEGNEVMSTFKNDKSKIRLIAQRYRSSDFIGTITTTSSCDAISNNIMNSHCQTYKDRAFINFMGCGVTSSQTLNGNVDVECLKKKKYDCVKIKADNTYYRRCLSMVSQVN